MTLIRTVLAGLLVVSAGLGRGPVLSLGAGAVERPQEMLYKYVMKRISMIYSFAVVTGLICCFYTIIGGMKATVWIDTFQVGILVIGIYFLNYL